jgi:hypothetical protein
MVWPMHAKFSACSSLQPVQKKRQEEVKFTFNVGKCDKIFDELLKNDNIRINHIVPSADELIRRAYCKWHKLFSHATNDCNVFRRQIQSTINEGRLKFQEMQVDTVLFPMNVIDFEGKKVLIRPGMADKGKGKEVIIDDARKANENNKISCRKVVAEKTPDGRETLKITITTSNTRGQAQAGNQVLAPVLCIADGPTHRHGRSRTPPDSPDHSSGRSGNAQGPRRPRTFKPRRPEIGTWKTNMFKAVGRLVRSGPTFDQLLSKYVKKKANPSNRPAKRPRSPTQKRQQIRPIGPSHQSEKTEGHTVQLRPNVPAWTPPLPYLPMSYQYTYIPSPHAPNQMWSMPPYPFGMPQYPAWAAPQTSVFNRLAPPVQDRLSATQSDHQAQAQQDFRTTLLQRSTNPAGGHIPTATKRMTKRDIIKIGTTDVNIQGNNEEPMFFGKSASTSKEGDTTAIKTADPKYSMPRW